MATDHYIARPSVDLITGRITVGNHIEYDTESGVGNLATVSTGVAQSNGIFTINESGIYAVLFSMRCRCNNGFIGCGLYDDNTGLLIPDVAGIQLRNFTDDDRTTGDTTEMATAQSIFEFTAGDLIRIEFDLVSSPVTVYSDGTVFEMLRVA